MQVVDGRFRDFRWKAGRWDMNEFKDSTGEVNWDDVIDAEMARRKLLEETPIPSITEEAVVFDTSEIPWWAWVKRFHLPEVRSALLIWGQGWARSACCACCACCARGAALARASVLCSHLCCRLDLCFPCLDGLRKGLAGRAGTGCRPARCALLCYHVWCSGCKGGGGGS
jgi:hypothetical protein